MTPHPKALLRFPVLRQSALSTFDNCALTSKFETDYEANFSSHPAARGQIVHRTLARCLELMEERDEEQIPVDLALQILDEVIRQNDVPMDGDPLGEEVVPIPLREVAQARVTVKTWALYTRWKVRDFAGVEKRLEAKLLYPGPQGEAVERRVTGKLDLLIIEHRGEHAIVVDWKDTWGIPSEPSDGDVDFGDDHISQEGYFQQRFYALLVFRHYPRVQRVTLREFYPRYASGRATDRQGRPINPVREATIDRWVLPEIEAELSALVERFDRAYETGKFRPAPGTHCAYCVRPEACTIFPGARGEGRIGSWEDAEKLAGRLNVLDALKRQTTKALRTWSNAHGEVRVRDAKRPRVYGPVVRPQQVKPTVEQVRDAIARGQDPAELYTTKDVVKFVVHTPEEQHPHAAAARAEEEALLAMERAVSDRKAARA